jgi:transposase-like protein
MSKRAHLIPVRCVERSHGAVWQWTNRLADSDLNPSLAMPARVAIDETAAKINGEWNWRYAAVDLDSLYLPDITVFSHHDTDPAAAFLHRLTEKYGLADADYLVNARGYRTTLSIRTKRSDQTRRPKPHRKVVSNRVNADRPLPLVLAGQSGQR